ncbi:hypothetical protein STANM309S_00965 [Streptomyces tanashiensis]
MAAGWTVNERVERLLLPCGADFDAFLGRLAGNPPELETVANLMVDGGFARAVPVVPVGSELAVVTFAQAQERAEEWINGDLPAYQHREVRVREFELGFVVWAEDREGGPTSDGGRQRLVIARSGEATLWPGLPVGEVIRLVRGGVRGDGRGSGAGGGAGGPDRSESDVVPAESAGVAAGRCGQDRAAEGGVARLAGERERVGPGGRRVGRGGGGGVGAVGLGGFFGFLAVSGCDGIVRCVFVCFGGGVGGGDGSGPGR